MKYPQDKHHIKFLLPEEYEAAELSRLHESQLSVKGLYRVAFSLENESRFAIWFNAQLGDIALQQSQVIFTPLDADLQPKPPAIDAHIADGRIDFTGHEERHFNGIYKLTNRPHKLQLKTGFFYKFDDGVNLAHSWASNEESLSKSL